MKYFIANVRIRTANLRCPKRPLCQLRHNQSHILKSFFVKIYFTRKEYCSFESERRFNLVSVDLSTEPSSYNFRQVIFSYYVNIETKWSNRREASLLTPNFVAFLVISVKFIGQAMLQAWQRSHTPSKGYFQLDINCYKMLSNNVFFFTNVFTNCLHFILHLFIHSNFTFYMGEEDN